MNGCSSECCVGWLRGDLDESELQSLYAEASKNAVNEIARDRNAVGKAEKAVEHAIEDLIESVPHVENVIFVD